MKNNFLIFLFVFAAFSACSKKAEKVELKYTTIEMDNLLHEASPSHEAGTAGLSLSDYAPGVNRVESKALMYQHLSFFIVAFDTGVEACAEARRLNQYCARNWLLDRVEGEPILEDYLIERLKAINPNRKIQRVPKKAISAHGEEHAQPESSAHH
jgi:hypothetical protein